MKTFKEFITEAKYTPDDLIAIHNNLAKRKGLPKIEFGTYGKKTDARVIKELGDKIDRANRFKVSGKPRLFANWRKRF